MSPPNVCPRGDRRIVINWDTANMWSPAFQDGRGKSADKKALEMIIDEHARAKVDTVVHCVYQSLMGYISSSHAEIQTDPDTLGLEGLRLAKHGLDLMEFLVERCHRHNMEILAAFRMNDRHPPSRIRLRQWVQAKGHSEWLMADWEGLDFSYDEVRQLILSVVRDTLEAYDFDGVELDWLRWLHMFPIDSAVAKSHLLTDLVCRLRDIVDEFSERRGRKLLLSARVPCTMKECYNLGYDIEAWIKQGGLDYICPSDWLFTDFNIRTDEFVSLTEGTGCKVYPSVHPTISAGNQQQRMQIEHYRAAARNYYAFGADGISVYNYQYHWTLGMEVWPDVMSYLTELRNPQALEKHDRHYLYHPIFGDRRWYPSMAPNEYRIVLDRSKDRPDGALQFRMAEDLSNTNISAILEFKVTCLFEGDSMVIEINGQEVGDDHIERIYQASGQKESEGKWIPAYFLYRIPLSSAPAVFGDNELRLRLTKSVDKRRWDPHIQELEVRVKTTG